MKTKQEDGRTDNREHKADYEESPEDCGIIGVLSSNVCGNGVSEVNEPEMLVRKVRKLKAVLCYELKDNTKILTDSREYNGVYDNRYISGEGCFFAEKNISEISKYRGQKACNTEYIADFVDAASV